MACCNKQERGAFEGLSRGRRLLLAYINSYEGTPEYAQLYRATLAVETIKNGGTQHNFLYWVAVVQNGRARRRREGDVRIADTDFSVNPFG